MLIGGLYPHELPEWFYGLHGKTLELAVPIPLANQFLKRIRQLFDEAAEEGMPVTATYRRYVAVCMILSPSPTWRTLNQLSGINIKVSTSFLWEVPV